MTANVSDLNSSANTKTSDFDGFLNEPPYCYGWTTNAKGVKVPVFPIRNINFRTFKSEKAWRYRPEFTIAQRISFQTQNN